MSENWIDQSWKNVINRNADDAIAFFMPELAAERDYTKQPEAADPQHSPIEGESNKGSRISDVCLAVPLKTGNVPRAVFLIEQQHETDKTIGLRMFQSFYRASDEFQVPVTSLAIFTGPARPIGSYFWSWLGTSVDFRYNIFSVAEADAEKLKRDSRLFALPVLAGKRMLDAKGRPKEREEYSLELLDLLESKGLKEEKAWSIKRFIYRILQIGGEDINPKVREVWKMRFRPIDEVIRNINIQEAKEIAREEAKEEKAFEIAKNLVSNGVPLEVIAKSSGLPLEDIRSMVRP
jgi:hypothetical protein